MAAAGAAATPSVVSRSRRILVAGGDQDFNLKALAETLARRGHGVLCLQVGADHHPWVSWELESGRLLVDGAEVRPDAAFLRYDVFTHLADRRPESAYRAAAWHTTLAGWLAAHEEVRWPNRASYAFQTNKAHVLHLARQAGLDIPPTLVTNHLGEAARFQEDRGKIVKPVNGGSTTRRLRDVAARTPSREDGVAASPAFVQSELVPPEIRIYGIGGRHLAFAVESPHLDYRETQDCRVVPTEVPAALAAGLDRLMARLGLDFGAADFKTDPETGRLLFLEINTGPMFGAFDLASKGAVTAALAELLES